MSSSLDQTILSRRHALLLAATTSLGATSESLAFASDSTKTGSHQESGNCSTPRSAVAKTQYGRVRGSLADQVFTFKGVPYGQTTAGENR